MGPPPIPTLAILLLALPVALSGCLTPSIMAEAAEPTVREFHLEAVDVDVELYPGKVVRAWTYNGQLPGPVLRATEGDLVRVHFTNNGTQPHTIHFHGTHPYEMDGDDYQPVLPGAAFTYEFVAGPPGAYVYHCHVDTPLHIPMGLYGQFIVDPREGWPGEAPDKEFFIVFSDWNPRQNHTAETYLLNGKAFPATQTLQVEQGDRVRLYLSSFSEFPVAAHLHGYLPQQTWPIAHPIDVVPLAHAESRVIEFTASAPGAWMFHDHYETHLTNDGVYPGGSLTAIEVGRDWWGRFSEHMDGHGTHAGTRPGHASHAGTGNDDGTTEPPADAVVVGMREAAFTPAALEVPAGTTVVWRNDDAMGHTVTSDAQDGPLDSGMVKPGRWYAHTFERAGTFRYHCAPHSWDAGGERAGMVGTVTVV